VYPALWPHFQLALTSGKVQSLRNAPRIRLFVDGALVLLVDGVLVAYFLLLFHYLPLPVFVALSGPCGPSLLFLFPSSSFYWL